MDGVREEPFVALIHIATILFSPLLAIGAVVLYLIFRLPEKIGGK